MQSSTFILLALSCLAYSMDKMLKFKEDGTFKLSQLTDLHFANDIDHNRETQEIMKTVLNIEKPDLVVLTGDMITGLLWNRTENWFAHLYKQVVEPMNELDYNWIMTLGNHDHQGELTGKQIHQLDMTYERSLTKPNAANISHSTNYIIPIYDATGEQIVARIWMFDTGDMFCMGRLGYDCIRPDQIEWYRNESQKIPEDDPYRSNGIAFFHIPTDEWIYLYNDLEVQGLRGEDVCCSSKNTGVLQAFQEEGTIGHVFVGHDHRNDYLGDFEGLKIGYGRKSGAGTFHQWFHKMKVGSRIFELSVDPWRVETWIRNEDGEREIQEPHTRKWYEIWNYQFICKVL